MKSKKLIRLTTISLSLDVLLKGQLAYISNFFSVLAVADGREHLNKVRDREQVKVRHVKMNREINPIQDLFSLIALVKLFKKEQPDIVHTNTPKGSLLAMLAAWICRVPHRIYTVTGLRFETTSGNFRRLLVGMEKLTCACATKVIPEGDGVKNTLIREKITSKPLQKILNGNINGIDLNYFDQTKEVLSIVDLNNIKSSDFTFVFVGRMVKDKGIHELVRAFCRLNKKKQSTRLLLVGPLEPELDPIDKDVLDLINTHDKIKWVGYQSDVRPFLAASDALAFASYREGFPNVVLQAGAMGLPSIVTDINGCNEIILEGKNGLIVPPQNEEALFNAMLYFIKHPDEVNEMAQNSRSLIADRYEQKKVWDATLQMYKDLFNKDV